MKKPQEIRTFLGEKMACGNGRSLRTQESSFSRPQLLQSKQRPTQQAQDSTPCRAHAPTVVPPTGMTDGEGLRLRPVQQRLPVRRHQRAPSKAERETTLAEFRDFSASLKLRSPIPLDVVSRSIRDPLKQKEIHEVALRDILEPPGSTPRKSSNAHHQAAYNHRPYHCPVAYVSPPSLSETIEGLNPGDQGESKGSHHGLFTRKTPGYAGCIRRGLELSMIPVDLVERPPRSQRLVQLYGTETGSLRTRMSTLQK